VFLDPAPDPKRNIAVNMFFIQAFSHENALCIISVTEDYTLPELVPQLLQPVAGQEAANQRHAS
jgi:hypothetical protein